ncbi:MAG: NAD(P)-dependent alcohol dehydrogenase [Cyanobacteria bacterium P01_D01_bin.56]
MRLEEIKRPVPQDHEVLVQVHASSINGGDWHLMRGTPFLIRLIFGGILKPKIKTLGADVAGRVVAVGKGVTRFKPGDDVFGDVSEDGMGAFAEYVCAAEDALVLKPTEISFEKAATVPAAAMAALQALRDNGQIQPGQTVLINGASGGVGSFAVQIAKALGAEVTGVCSTAKMDMVRSLGADHVIDYRQTEITQAEQQYDLILDAAAYRSFFAFLPIIKPGGTYVVIGGATAPFFQAMLLGPWVAKFRNRQIKGLAMNVNHDDLVAVKELMVAGKISPFIDRSYPLQEVPNAIRRMESRQVQGKIAISVASD